MTKKEEILQKIEELKQEVEKLGSEYPKYMWSHNNSKSNQTIVKFVGECIGEVVASTAESVHGVGYKNENYIPCTDKTIWKEVTNPSELCDKDLVECWNSDYTHTRHYKFYDTKNKCTFFYDGSRGGVNYVNYRKLMPWEEMPWVKEARKTLEN